MAEMRKIRPPFFEIGPKAYLFGEELLDFAKGLDRIAQKYDVDMILTVPATDIYPVARAVERLLVFAQHMDSLYPGRGLGSILPEAVKAAGACGVMLNHDEKKLTLSELAKCILRAREVGLLSIVCADSVRESAAVAILGPDIVVAEPSELIGTGKTSGMDYVQATIDAVRKANPNVYVLQGAGIKNGKDVYDVIAAGADATGSTSGILLAQDRLAMADEMIKNLVAAYRSRSEK